MHRVASMAVSFEKLVFRCPMAGMVVFCEDRLFEVEAVQSPHVRLFIDWRGQPYAAHPSRVPKAQRRYVERLRALLADPRLDDRDDGWLRALLDLLPASCLVIELVETGRPTRPASACWVVFDLGDCGLTRPAPLDPIPRARPLASGHDLAHGEANRGMVP